MGKNKTEVGGMIFFYREPNSVEAQEYRDRRPGGYQHLCGFGFVDEICHGELEGEPVYFYEVKPIGGRFNSYYEMIRLEDKRVFNKKKDTLTVTPSQAGSDVGLKAVALELSHHISDEHLTGLFRSQHDDPAETNFRRERFEFLRDVRLRIAKAIQTQIRVSRGLDDEQA